MRLTRTGNLGINETSPDAPLHITGGLPHIRLENSGTSASANDIFGQIDFKHNDSSDPGVTAAIKCVAEDANGNSFLAFYNGDGGNADERLRITSGGVVQITGADDQDNLLVKAGNTHFAVHQDDTDGEVSLRAQDGSGSNNSKYMTFFTNPSGSAATERLRIKSDGRVVIGNTTGNQPSATVGGAQFYGGSYPGDFRISSGAGASGTEPGSIAIMGSNHNADIANGNNYGASLNLYNYNSNTGNSSAVSFHNKNGLSSARILGLNIDHDNRDGALVFMVADGSHPTEAARIMQNKNLGIQASSNVNSPVEIGKAAHYVITNSGQARNGIHIRGQGGNSGEFGGAISFGCNPSGGTTAAAAIAAEQMSSDADVIGLSFFTHETSTGADNAEKKMKINSNGGIILNNWESNRGYIFERLGAGTYPDFPNVQGSNGRGMCSGQRAIAANTATEIAKSHWGGLALIGYSNSQHQGTAQVMFGYGGAGASAKFEGHWVRQESLTITYTVSTYSLMISHNASNDLNVWCVLIGV